MTSHLIIIDHMPCAFGTKMKTALESDELLTRAQTVADKVTKWNYVSESIKQTTPKFIALKRRAEQLNSYEPLAAEFGPVVQEIFDAYKSINNSETYLDTNQNIPYTQMFTILDEFDALFSRSVKIQSELIQFR